MSDDGLRVFPAAQKLVDEIQKMGLRDEGRDDGFEILRKVGMALSGGRKEGVSKERDVTTFFTVRVPSFGKPEKVEEDLLVSLHRALYNAIGEGVMIQKADGTWTRFDPLADDGHHPGHDVRLIACYPPEISLGGKGSNKKPPKQKVL